MGALRLPDALGDLLGAYAGAQWYYFVGHLASRADPDVLFSVEFQILRVRELAGLPPVTFSLIGVGDERDGSTYHYALEAGGAALDAPTWDRFGVASHDLDGQACINYTYAGGPGVGLAGSSYALTARATATTKPGGGKAAVAASLELADARGTMLEGASGALLNTYEFSQPRLDVAGGFLQIGDETIAVGGGSLWNDMQTIFTAFNGTLPRRFGAALPPTYQWLSLTLDGGACLELSSLWYVHENQWRSGNKSGFPARTGFGVFYRPRKADAYAYAGGGYPVAPLHDCAPGDDAPPDCPYPEGVPWDFSVDVFDGAHWTSPDTNRTYATALEVSFGARLAADVGHDALYVYQIVDNGEAVLSTSTESVAAARVFDRPRGEPGAALVGAAVVEQYGYN